MSPENDLAWISEFAWRVNNLIDQHHAIGRFNEMVRQWGKYRQDQVTSENDWHAK